MKSIFFLSLLVLSSARADITVSNFTDTRISVAVSIKDDVTGGSTINTVAVPPQDSRIIATSRIQGVFHNIKANGAVAAGFVADTVPANADALLSVSTGGASFTPYSPVVNWLSGVTALGAFSAGYSMQIGFELVGLLVRMLRTMRASGNVDIGG